MHLTKLAREYGDKPAVIMAGSGARLSYAELERYLERRMVKGLLRPVPDVTVAARVVTESVSWFAWHRHQGRDAALYDDQTARRTVIEFVCAALLPASAPVIQAPEPGSASGPAANGSPGR